MEQLPRYLFIYLFIIGFSKKIKTKIKINNFFIISILSLIKNYIFFYFSSRFFFSLLFLRNKFPFLFLVFISTLTGPFFSFLPQSPNQKAEDGVEGERRDGKRSRQQQEEPGRSQLLLRFFVFPFLFRQREPREGEEDEETGEVEPLQRQQQASEEPAPIWEGLTGEFS